MTNSSILNFQQQSFELIERFAQYVMKNVKNPSSRAALKELPLHALYFTNAMEHNKASHKVYQDVLKKVESSTEDLDCDEILKQFDEEIISISKESTSNENYKNFLKSISEPNDNDEIVAISETVINVDPITKLPITDPVKNKQCGHIYEKSSILQLIKKNAKTKCPIAGCNASDCVRKSDLVPDNNLKRLLIDHNQKSKKIKIGE